MEDLEALVKFTTDSFGKVDILVNNAAANPVFGPVVNTPVSAFDKIMDEEGEKGNNMVTRQNLDSKVKEIS